MANSHILCLCLFGLLIGSALSSMAPQRPNISETFSGWFETTALYADGASMSYEIYSGYLSVVANSKMIVNVTTPGEADSTLTLYDQMMEYDLYCEEDPYYGCYWECDSYGSDIYEPLWDFQEDLEYVGRQETLNVDVWTAAYSDSNVTLAVSASNPNEPLLLVNVDFYENTITKSTIAGFRCNMPSDSDFNVSPACSDYASRNSNRKSQKKPQGKHSKKFLGLFQHKKRKNQRRHNTSGNKNWSEKSRKNLAGLHHFKNLKML